MNTSEKVLFILESNKSVYTSGEEMAGQCGVSRNAVWKAIRDLREKGYVIEAISNKGYRLAQNTDIISAEGIRAGLPKDLRNVDIALGTYFTHNHCVAGGCGGFACHSTHRVLFHD